MLAGMWFTSAGMPRANCSLQVLLSCLVSLLIAVALAIAGDGITAKWGLAVPAPNRCAVPIAWRREGNFGASVFTNVVLVH